MSNLKAIFLSKIEAYRISKNICKTSIEKQLGEDANFWDILLSGSTRIEMELIERIAIVLGVQPYLLLKSNFTENDFSSYGKYLQTLRASKGFSRETFGKMIGVSRQTVGNWETNQKNPTKEHKIQIEKILKQ